MLTHTILHCLCCRGPAGTVTCYLCKEEINLELWLSGDHRRGCASRQTVQLSLLPSHPAVDCTHCNKRLRLWPDQQLPFLCHQCNFQSDQGWSVVRYHCFSCDYTLCGDCARDIEAVLGDGTRQENNLTSEDNMKLIVLYP